MIAWKIYSVTGQLLAVNGEISLLFSEIDKLRQNPFNSAWKNCHHVGRTVDGEYYDVFLWNPLHQIIIDQYLQSKSRHHNTSIDRNAFWEKVPGIIKNQFGTNFELFLDEELVINITEINQLLDLRSFLGYYGYISFELSRLIEQYYFRNNELNYPYVVLEFPSILLIRHQKYTIYIEIDLPNILEPEIKIRFSGKDIKHNQINHNTDITEYLKDIATIINHIQLGDIYQANYTQQFEVTTPQHPLSDLYHSIIQQQKLPHAAFLNYSDTFQVMSLSPELFLQISGGKALTKPIKGTRPRGRNESEDAHYIRELINSDKDQAELAMIVDLLRNDLGKSANPGSVVVENHAEVESFENVHHLVSTIAATIETNLEASWRLLLRAFPGGSISGVPKLRSLEIIERLEKIPRGIYTGSIGFLGLNGDLEFNIAIRTAIKLADRTVFHAGGGIVFDSDPFSEYLETLHKAKHVAKYLGYDFTGHIVYYNGDFHNAESIEVIPSSYGIFETILVENGEIPNMESHRRRIDYGLQYLNLECRCPSDDTIKEFLALNLVSLGTFRLNIYNWRDQNDQILMKVQRYEIPTASINLLLHDGSIEPPVSIKQGLKSLDYEIYRQATKEAISNDCWDTILLNRKNMVLEGGRSTIYYYLNETWYTPATDVVHGTIRQKLLDQKLVELRDISKDELLNSRAIAVSNALIGVQTVKSIRNNENEIWCAKTDDVLELQD